MTTVLGGAAGAAADPIQLVGGSIFYSRGNLAVFAVRADDDTSVRSEFGNFAAETWNADHSCFACVPGTTIDLSQSESLAFGNDEMGVGGSFLAEGAEYWIESLVFQIAAASLMLPDSTNGAVTLSSPFSFLGVVTGRTLAGAPLTLSLFGTRIATATFAGNDWFGTSYQFAAATPEPGTLFLLGGPALALLRKRAAFRYRRPRPDPR